MCLIAWNWQAGEHPELLLVANRDEFHARPAAALHVWEGGHILAGKDLQGGGTWLGLSRGGRFAALTNYRNPSMARTGTPTRGQLVTGFLSSTLTGPDYLARVAADAKKFNPFNLLVFDGRQLLGFESRHDKTIKMNPGLGGVSNADFHSPWPKLVKLKSRLGRCVVAGDTGNRALLAALADRTMAADADLPATGLPLARERALSAAFIDTPGYGTRASSIVRLNRLRAELLEASFDEAGFTGLGTDLFDLRDPGARAARRHAGASGRGGCVISPRRQAAGTLERARRTGANDGVFVMAGCGGSAGDGLDLPDPAMDAA